MVCAIPSRALTFSGTWIRLRPVGKERSNSRLVGGSGVEMGGVVSWFVIDSGIEESISSVSSTIGSGGGTVPSALKTTVCEMTFGTDLDSVYAGLA